MKHKVGDKVRIKSREWYEENKDEDGDVQCGETLFVDSMVRYCGNTATITSVDRTYRLDIGKSWEWTDEMFEDDTPHPSEIFLQDIANVIKSHNMGIQVSEQDGKLIIEPVEKKKEDDLPIDTLCMCSNPFEGEYSWFVRYYAGNKQTWWENGKSTNEKRKVAWKCIIPWDKFNPKDISESLKYNIVKS